MGLVYSFVNFFFIEINYLILYLSKNIIEFFEQNSFKFDD